MLSKFNKNIKDINIKDINIKDIKKLVNKPKPKKEVKIKMIDKYIDIDEENSINISVQAKTIKDSDDREVVLYEKNINKMIESIAVSIVNNINEDMIFPKNIIISSNDYLIDSIQDLDEMKGYDGVDMSIIDLQTPKYDFDNIILNDEIKKGISRILSISKNRDKIVNEWGIKNSLSGKNPIVCNFYGVRGSGKKCMIHAIANELNKNVMIVNYNQLKSISISDIPKTIKSIFKLANYKNALVVIDDSDELIRKKSENDNKYYSDIITIIKSSIKIEIGKFNSILFFTSDNDGQIEEFFRRIFFINLELKKPDEYEREKMWELYMSDKVKLSPILNYKSISQRYVNISGADIRDMIFIASCIALEENRDVLYESDFDLAYNQILGKYE